MTVREELTQEIQETSDSVLEEVLNFLLFLKSRKDKVKVATNQNQSIKVSGQNTRPIWELFEEVTDNLHDEVLADLPTDGAAQHDHYLYGSPK